ncbi:hypothetical protein B0J11DRAFT_494602 [Dendryphion nanum]|uniref:Cyclin C-terminal domain-containing protein n=1 Tax=Dendryphion nanum TaxID=256645 RepID=A0A9P9IEL6_9PLEO|nr:hypothetical protein B0J11DRAFT_494602 [Dendryphion nanum]
MQVNEDFIYRSSSQYRNWSFTPAQLAEQRQKTNLQAAERVKANVARQRAERNRQLDGASVSESERANGSGLDTGTSTPIPLDREVNCLTVAEEKRLLDYFCAQAQLLGNFLEFPIEVTATGIQFVRRFYLYNSPMTYEPQTISRSIMFIANKVEGFGLSAKNYALKLPNTTADTVIAPEYLIVQGLRFTFDVRHPFRGLRGGHIEMMEMASGNAPVLPEIGLSADDIQTAMLVLPNTPNGPPTDLAVPELVTRIQNAYAGTSDILKSAALLTDAYFHYTPSQVWLAAHLMKDEPLTLFYISTKLPTSSPTYPKLLSTLRACGDLLRTHNTDLDRLTKEEKDARQKREKEEIGALVKKLKACRDPDKMDLVKLNEAQKRDAVKANGELEENKAKRRKVAREGFQKESDSFWGPELPKNKNSANGAGNSSAA